MKLTHILSGAAFCALAGSAFADATVDITGATAFRVGAIKAIVAGYGANLADVAHSGTTTATNGHESATYSIFRGTFPGVSGTTIIRCHWTGSVEGINALATPVTETFLTTAAFSAGVAYTGPGTTTNRRSVGDGADPAFAFIAFSDTLPTSSPYDGSNLTSTSVGVLPFFAVINDGAPAGYTNMQSDKFGILMNEGFRPASFFFPTTSTVNVYATGRNDGSGTRTNYLASSRSPTSTASGDISGVVQQWKPVITGAAGAEVVSTLRLWPLNDGVNRSLVWQGDTLGNGGFASGGTVASALLATSGSVQLLNTSGNPTGSPVPLHLVSVVGLSDAVAAQTGGARVLSWNGQAVTVTSPLAAGEIAKFENGSYTLWSFEQLITRNDADTDTQTVAAQIATDIPTFFGTSGIDAAGFQVGRDTDGSYVK